MSFFIITGSQSSPSLNILSSTLILMLDFLIKNDAVINLKQLVTDLKLTSGDS